MDAKLGYEMVQAPCSPPVVEKGGTVREMRLGVLGNPIAGQGTQTAAWKA